MHIDPFIELSLVDARGAGQDSQNARMGRRQLQWCQSLGQFPRGTATYLREKKSDRQILARLSVNHEGGISQVNHYYRNDY
jgi:hypothetical protein